MRNLVLREFGRPLMCCPAYTDILLVGKDIGEDISKDVSEDVGGNVGVVRFW